MKFKMFELNDNENTYLNLGTCKISTRKNYKKTINFKRTC